MKKYLPALPVFCLLLCSEPKGAQQKVMEKYFPECIHQMIGATSGAECSYDQKSREWHIQYWGNGRGDCPAGCIEKDYFGSYAVDAKGDVYEGADPKKRRKIDPAEVSKWESELYKENRQRGVSENDPLGCMRDQDCFWYQCCSTRPMSRIYQQSHWKDVYLLDNKTDHCVMECEHAPIPKDKKLACIDLTCRAVAKNFPKADPYRPALWIGRVTSAPQCRPEFGAGSISAALIIKSADKPEIEPGPKFSEWAAKRQKELIAGKEGRFACRACDICFYVKRDYLLIFADERGKFNSQEWQDVAP